MITKLSIFIIAKNEGDRIGRTLEAIKDLGSEIVVIDSGSTDNTIEVAKSYGAEVFFHEWHGYGEQKRFGEDCCKNEWLLNLDADEVITQELYYEIKALFDKGEPEPQGFSFPIIETFPFEKQPHKFAYALYPVRLYHKTIGRYNPSTVHDRVDLAEGAKVTQLSGRVCHYSVRSLGEQIIKLNAYADLQARDLINRNKKISKLRAVFEFPAAFLKAYIGRRHFMRGIYGFFSAMNYAFYRHLRLAKYFEIKLSNKSKNV